jgi:hypothetical protein
MFWKFVVDLVDVLLQVVVLAEVLFAQVALESLLDSGI